MSSYDKCLWDEWNRIEHEISSKQRKVEQLESWFGSLLLDVEENDTPFIRQKSDSSTLEYKSVDIDGDDVSTPIEDSQPEAPLPVNRPFRVGGAVYILIQVYCGRIESIVSDHVQDQFGVIEPTNGKFGWLKLNFTPEETVQMTQIRLNVKTRYEDVIFSEWVNVPVRSIPHLSTFDFKQNKRESTELYRLFEGSIDQLALPKQSFLRNIPDWIDVSPSEKWHAAKTVVIVKIGTLPDKIIYRFTGMSFDILFHSHYS